jgi:hypothetical protein
LPNVCPRARRHPAQKERERRCSSNDGGGSAWMESWRQGSPRRRNTRWAGHAPANGPSFSIIASTPQMICYMSCSRDVALARSRWSNLARKIPSDPNSAYAGPPSLFSLFSFLRRVHPRRREAQRKKTRSRCRGNQAPDRKQEPIKGTGIDS